jgi:hypothetical protein
MQHTYIFWRKRGKQNTHRHIIMPPLSIHVWKGSMSNEIYLARWLFYWMLKLFQLCCNFFSFYYAKLNHNVLLLITKLLYKFDKAIYKTFILINRCVLGNPCVIVVINMFFFYDVCMLKKKQLKVGIPYL